MVELLEVLLTSSFFHIVSHLAEMTLTDMMVIFLLSKPLFMIIAVGALLSGRRWGDSHYLHHRDCDRFLSQSFSNSGTCSHLPREMTLPAAQGSTNRYGFRAPHRNWSDHCGD